MPVIQFEGQTHQFPDDFTPADIQRALSTVPPAGPPAPPISGPNLTPGGVPIGADGLPRVEISQRADRPAALLPTSVGGAARDFGVGAQGVGKGMADIVTGPFDLVAGAQNLATSGVNKVFGTNIPQATPASKLLEQGAEAIGVPGIDPETMSNSEKLAYDASRFGTQAIGVGSMLAQRAPQVLAQTTPSPTFVGKTLDTFARPYAETPGAAHVGDAVGGAGAGIAAGAADRYIPDDAATGGTATKQIANALAPIAGGASANTLQGVVQGLGGMIKNLVRNRLSTPPAPVPLNPQNHKPYSQTEVDRAAQTMQSGTANPQLQARNIRENADELANPTLPGETPVSPSQMPTSGHLSRDAGLVTMEEQARLKDRVPFIERDQNIKAAAADRVASVKDEGADLGSVMRRAGEARTEAMAPVDQRVGQFEDINNRVTQQRQNEGATYAPIANSDAKATASQRLDTAVVDQGYVPARAEKNRQFDTAPGRNEQLPADDVFAAIDRVRAGANGLAPGTLPNDFMARLDRLRPVIDPESGANVGGPGTASGADLADLRKFVGAAQQRAQESGNFDLADNLAGLRTSLNRAIEQAPGYAEANANYGQFADRYRPNAADEGAKFTKQIDRSGNTEGVPNRGNTPPSETAGRFLASPEKAQALQRILDGAPNAAQGNAAVRDYMRSDFASTALNPDGTLNPNKAAGWARNNADVLAQFPALRTEFDNITATARRGEQLSTTAQAELKAAHTARNQTEQEVDRGAIGTLLREDPRDVASKLLNGGYASEKKLDDIIKTIGTDAEAKRGWKAAVAEVLTDKVTSARKVGESNEVQLARLSKEFKDNEALLAKTFTPEEMNTLRQGHKMLEYFKEADKRATVGSQTAERASIPGSAQLVIRHLYGDLKGGGIIKRFKLLLEQLPSSKQGADDIVHAAWFDPNLAAFLLERKIPNPKASFNNVPLRRLLGAANAARESGPDQED